MTSKPLTKAQRRVLARLDQNVYLGVGHEPGDECRPKTARELCGRGLATIFATGEFEADGPYIWIVRKRQDD